MVFTLFPDKVLGEADVEVELGTTEISLNRCSYKKDKISYHKIDMKEFIFTHSNEYELAQAYLKLYVLDENVLKLS